MTLSKKELISSLKDQITNLESGNAPRELNDAHEGSYSLSYNEYGSPDASIADRSEDVSENGFDTFNRTTFSKASRKKKQGSSKERDYSSDKEAFSRILRIVNVTDKSEAQLRSKLSQDGFEQTAIDKAIDRALDLGFVNDARFADVLIRSRISQGKGIAGIERELLSNNISPADIEGWPDEYLVDAPDEFSRAMSLLQMNPPRSKNKRDGAYRKLVSKGFSSSVASSVARIWSEQLT